MIGSAQILYRRPWSVFWLASMQDQGIQGKGLDKREGTVLNKMINFVIWIKNYSIFF